MKNNLIRKVRSVYNYLGNRKSFVSGQRRPAGIQIFPLRKLTFRQKRYFGFGKRMFLNGFRRPVKRSLLIRTFLLKAYSNFSSIILQLNERKSLKIISGHLTSFMVGYKKLLNLRRIRFFGVYLDYVGFVIAKNLWFMRNPTTIPGAAHLRRRKAFYGYQIRVVDIMRKQFGNLRFHELLKLYTISINKPVNKVWFFIQNIEALLPVICTKLGFATSIYSSYQYLWKHSLSINGFPFKRNLQMLHPGDIIKSNSIITENTSSYKIYGQQFLSIPKEFNKVANRKVDVYRKKRQLNKIKK
jgi:hypothetical protein